MLAVLIGFFIIMVNLFKDIMQKSYLLELKNKYCLFELTFFNIIKYIKLQISKLCLIEIFLPIQNYPGYYISNFGKVKSIKNNKSYFLKHKLCRYGYHRVRLRKDNKECIKSINRLVLENFIGFCDEKQVNHKNRIKSNNKLNNLEYMTASEKC